MVGISTDILVVDDHPAMRELLRMVLEDMGYDVAEANDGPGALAHLRETPAARSCCSICSCRT